MAWAKTLVKRKTLSKAEKDARKSARELAKKKEIDQARADAKKAREQADIDAPVYNFVTGKQYTNCNAEILREFAKHNGFKELKFAGFAQIKSIDMSVIKKATGVQIYKRKIGKTWEMTTVFNIEQCKKLSEKEIELKEKREQEKAIKKADSDAIEKEIERRASEKAEEKVAVYGQDSSLQEKYITLEKDFNEVMNEKLELQQKLAELQKQIELIQANMGIKADTQNLIDKMTADGDIPF